MTTWKIDKSHSTVEFVVKHMMVSRVRGRFAEFEGEINLDEENLANSSVNVVVDISSIDTKDEKRDEHLRSADFFDVANYPKLTFQSTEVRPLSGDRLQVIGDLTIRGVTQREILEVERAGTATSPWGYDVIGFEATSDLNRKDYGLTWNVALETGGFVVGDNIKINLGVEAIKQEAQASQAA
jgi:polyisoprenoid-binding protein YceI